MKIIGITGGVGSGKSEILNILKNDYQAKVIQSDHVAHELMVPGAKSYDAIVQAFGNEILKIGEAVTQLESTSLEFADVVEMLSKKIDGLSDEFAEIKREIKDDTLDIDGFVKMTEELEKCKENLKQLD